MWNILKAILTVFLTGLAILIVAASPQSFRPPGLYVFSAFLALLSLPLWVKVRSAGRAIAMIAILLGAACLCASILVLAGVWELPRDCDNAVRNFSCRQTNFLYGIGGRYLVILPFVVASFALLVPGVRALRRS